MIKGLGRLHPSFFLNILLASHFEWLGTFNLSSLLMVKLYQSYTIQHRESLSLFWGGGGGLVGVCTEFNHRAGFGPATFLFDVRQQHIQIKYFFSSLSLSVKFS
jgi:hypothetical protein